MQINLINKFIDFDVVLGDENEVNCRSMITTKFFSGWFCVDILNLLIDHKNR